MKSTWLPMMEQTLQEKVSKDGRQVPKGTECLLIFGPEPALFEDGETLSNHYHADAALVSNMGFSEATTFLLPSKYPNANSDQYDIDLDKETGIYHVHQSKLTLQHVFGLAKSPAALSVKSVANSTPIQVSDSGSTASSESQIDNAVLAIGKARKDKAQVPTLNTTIAMSRSSSTSIMSSFSSLFDKESSTQPSSRATSSASGFRFSPLARDFSSRFPTSPSSRKPSSPSCIGFSPLANESKSITPSVLEIDPAIVQHPRKSNAGSVNGSSATDIAFFKQLLHQADSSLVATIEHVKPSVSGLDVVETGIVRKPLIHKLNDISVPYKTNGAFLKRPLGHTSEASQSLLTPSKLAEKYPLTASWVNRSIDNIQDVYFALELDNCKTSKVKSPLEELHLEAAREQMNAVFEYNSQNGAIYEEAVTKAKGTEATNAQVALRTPVRPREDLPSIEHVLNDTKASHSSSCTGTTPSTPVTTPSEPESEAEKVASSPPDYLDCAGLLCRCFQKQEPVELAWLNLIKARELYDPDFKLEHLDLSKARYRSPREPKAPSALDDFSSSIDGHVSDAQSGGDIDDGEAIVSTDAAITSEGEEISSPWQDRDEAKDSPQVEHATLPAEDGPITVVSDGEEPITLNAVEDCARGALTGPSLPSPTIQNDQDGATMNPGGNEDVQADAFKYHENEFLDLVSFPTLETQEIVEESSEKPSLQAFPSDKKEDNKKEEVSDRAISSMSDENPAEYQDTLATSSQDETAEEAGEASDDAAAGLSNTNLNDDHDVRDSIDEDPASGQAPLLGAANEDATQVVDYTPATLQEKFDAVFGEGSGNWADDDEIEETSVAHATSEEPAMMNTAFPSHDNKSEEVPVDHSALVNQAAMITISPPRISFPDIPTQWIDMFRAEEFKIWRDCTPQGPYFPGVDDSTVAELAQAALEAASEDVPKDIYQIANMSRIFYNGLWNQGHPKYGPFTLGTCTNGKVEDSVYVRELANKNVQWIIFAEKLPKKTARTQPDSQPIKSEKSETKDLVFSRPEGRTLHHINFNGDYIYKRSYTPPPVSLWAIGTTMWKHPFPGKKHCPLVHVKTVLMSQAFKYVDPVQYLGGDEKLPIEHIEGEERYLHGSRMRDLVTCDVEAIYQPYGSWVDDQYDQDDTIPIVWREGERFHDGQMQEYIFQPRPYFIDSRHDEHDNTSPKPKLYQRIPKPIHGHSPLWEDTSSEVELQYTKKGKAWHGVLRPKKSIAEERLDGKLSHEDDAASSEAKTEIESDARDPRRLRVDHKYKGSFDFSKVTKDPSTWPPPAQWPDHWPKQNMGFSKSLGYSPYVTCAEAKESLLKKLSAAIGKPCPEADRKFDDSATANDLSATDSLAPQPPHLFTGNEDPFEDEGSIFTYPTKCELARLQAARLLGVDIPWGRGRGDTDMVADEDESVGILETSEQDDLQRVPTSVEKDAMVGEYHLPKAPLDTLSPPEDALEDDRTAPAITHPATIWSWLEETKHGEGEQEENEQPQTNDQTKGERDEEMKEKQEERFIATPVIPLHNCLSDPSPTHMNQPATGYGLRHLFASVGIAWLVGFLWGKTP
ncbi:MAG: hypothetical protein Q9164_002892 [Protoblastenia rupestris]